MYPFIAAVLPIVILWEANRAELVPAGDVLPPIGLALVGAAIVLGLALLGYRERHRAAVAASVVVVLFFTYGYAWTWARDAMPGVLASHAAVVVTWTVLAIMGIVAVRVWGRHAIRLTAPLNGFAALLLALSLSSIGAYGLAARTDAVTGGDPLPFGGEVVRRPDIYWLIMDRYGSGDVLRRSYDFDNSPFLDALGERGFYVAEDATANYLKTALSLVSSRSMSYLDFDSLEGEAARGDDWGPFYRRLGAGFPVQEFLAGQGYQFIYAGSYWSPTDANQAADLNLRYEVATTEFQDVLMDTTLLRAVTSVWNQELDWRLRRWQITRHQFEYLHETVELGGPKLVHAHVTVPHDPYVFRADGTFQSEAAGRGQSEEELYVAQARYANGELLRLVDRLLALPEDERPVIIIQADEGPFPPRYRGTQDVAWADATDGELRDKFGILNAFYLPGLDPEQAGLYPSISSVNTFRVVLNAYFGADLPLLPDRQFIYPEHANIYEQVEVSDRFR